MFGMVAAKVKMNANGAHTFLEVCTYVVRETGLLTFLKIVKVRFGTAAHIVFTIYAFICVLVVCGSLLGEIAAYVEIRLLMRV